MALATVHWRTGEQDYDNPERNALHCWLFTRQSHQPTSHSGRSALCPLRQSAYHLHQLSRDTVRYQPWLKCCVCQNREPENDVKVCETNGDVQINGKPVLSGSQVISREYDCRRTMSIDLIGLDHFCNNAECAAVVRLNARKIRDPSLNKDALMTRHCERPGCYFRESGERRVLMACARCKSIRYCSAYVSRIWLIRIAELTAARRECQALHWSAVGGHKASCAKMDEARKSVKAASKAGQESV